ncbi:MAG: hypothetical protein Q8O00_16755 [Holophaga sp.]|nr:hypothetical protein [Holophaga sp.]
MAHEKHVHGPDCEHDEHDDHEIEVVELEDENGEKEEYAILDELDFEGRHFCIMAPLAEVQAFTEGEESKEEPNLSIEIFEVKDDDFTVLEDEEMAKRLLAHLDELSEKYEEEGN